MKRIHDSARFTELFVKAGLIAAIAATLLLPVSVSGAEAPRSDGVPSTPARQAWDGLPLPPIPYLNAIPWLALERGQKGPKIDTLLLPAQGSVNPAYAASGLPLRPAGSAADTGANG
jgi:hypothetical protein